MAEMITDEIRERAFQADSEVESLFNEIRQISENGAGGFLTIPNAFRENENALRSFRQILNSTAEFGSGEAPVALTSPESVTLFRMQMDEKDVNRLPSKVFDPNNIVFFDKNAVQEGDALSNRGMDNFRKNLADYAKESSTIGDIAYVTETYLAEANGEKLTKTQKDFRKEYLIHNGLESTRAFIRDISLPEALMMQEYLREEKGVYTELQASIDSGQASIVFNNEHDLTMAMTRNGIEEDVHFSMMRQAVQEIGMLDDNGNMHISTKTEIKQEDAFIDSKERLERESKAMLDRSARDSEAKNRLAILQHELIVMAEKLSKEREARRVDRNRRLAKEEEEQKKEREEQITRAKAYDEARAEAERIYENNKISLEGAESPSRNNKDNVIRDISNTIATGILLYAAMERAPLITAVAATYMVTQLSERDDKEDRDKDKKTKSREEKERAKDGRTSEPRDIGDDDDDRDDI